MRWRVCAQRTWLDQCLKNRFRNHSKEDLRQKGAAAVFRAACSIRRSTPGASRRVKLPLRNSSKLFVVDQDREPAPASPRTLKNPTPLLKKHKKSHPFSKSKKDLPGDGFGSQLGAKIREKPLPKIHQNFKSFPEAFLKDFASQNPSRGPPKTAQKPTSEPTASRHPDFLKMSVSPTRDTHFQGFADRKILQKSGKTPPGSLLKNS